MGHAAVVVGRPRRPAVSGNPLVVSTASRHLAASVLNAFPNTALAGRSDADRRDAHPRTLRRAIAFVEANAGRDISATDIAEAAHVSARAVQPAFRRHLDTTPMAYLRRVRLDCARAEPRAAVRGETTVPRVAARWGFARPSAFAARHRAVYGESPSGSRFPLETEPCCSCRGVRPRETRAVRASSPWYGRAAGTRSGPANAPRRTPTVRSSEPPSRPPCG
ncbi:helix-turn-helix transcriptional regulator [Actinoallomurus iriomotensis]|uniref:HTH araC/xylS-type domain-containing protein n=1 Tax=Actinoallomurus iriomotensis TaxID=478107 RepID=A0A9W6RIB4_9ACTN|nr:helix-turn-helix transcriptional regulator [Actinoallomurus iriomotensis]GLY75300.1 hypothetical protein Airi01_035670 [Actinoallomurus iriomotensis]